MNEYDQQFCVALERRDSEAICRLIHDFPALHQFEGEDGLILEILAYEWPDFLEVAFQAGLSPDACRERPIQTFLQGAAAEGDLHQLRLAIK
ncbi:MAG: hypothetical protein JO112_07280 [Planctomycetes bacterium]|nr:hypothetical protein [Planctomycetota bacterium]